MAERKRFSRWRRLPPVFRSGEHKLPGYEDETQRLTVYLPGGLLDLAEELADCAGVPTIQEYCTRLLVRALENERVGRHVAQVEAQRGPLEGLQAIAQDTEYLAEWRSQLDCRELKRPDREADPVPELTVPIAFLPDESDPDEADEPPADDQDGTSTAEPLTIRIETRRRFVEPLVAERMVPEVIDGRALDVVWNHVAPRAGEHEADARGFLPRLRRGEQAPAEETAELLEALRRLEEENRNLEGLDRRMAYALHRLALESQVLMTEAWPGAFDEPTISAIRAVQEMVERILSGEDVRFYSNSDADMERPAPEQNS